MTHSPESVDSDTFVLSIRGLRITARRTGSGDPLLLLNGLSRPMESWTDFAGALRGRIVITLDGPGVGASETPIVPYSMPMLSDIAARVLDAVGIEKADSVGFSHGGVVAQQFAVGHPRSGEPARAAVDFLWCRCRSRPRPRCNPHLACAEPRNTVAATGSVGLALAARGHLDLVQHPRSRLHRCTHPRDLRRPRHGRPAGEQRPKIAARIRNVRLVTICKSPARRPLSPSWWSSFSIRKLR